MTDRLVVLASAATTALHHGYLPAARRVARSVLLLTDRPQDHGEIATATGIEIAACDVSDPIAVIDRLERSGRRPSGIFSDSDRLQASAALVAQWFDLPGKDWRAAHAVKNKAVMRARLAASGIERVDALPLSGPDDLPAVQQFPFPAILKPSAGVASEDVYPVADPAAVRAHALEIWARSPERSLVLESFLRGELRTLETLGDGRDIRVLGGFACTLAPTPGFVVESMRWRSAIEQAEADAVLVRLRALGVGFGACHTEYVVGDAGVRTIEINYRTIGDGADRLMADVTGYSLYDAVLDLHLGASLSSVPIVAKTPVFAGLCYQFHQHRPPGPTPGCTYRHDILPLRHIGPGPLSNRHYRGRVSVMAEDAARLDQAIATIIHHDRGTVDA